MTQVNITEMIDIISDNVPEFLDLNEMWDKVQFDHIQDIILLSKWITIRKKIGPKTLQDFTKTFCDKVKLMISIDYKSEECYNYIQNFYDDLIDYCESAEEYEICANIRNFFLVLKNYTENNETENEIDAG